LKYLIYYLLLLGTSFAQPNIDSVFRSIARLEDSSKVDVLTKLCWDNRTNNPDEALVFAYAALGIAEKSAAKEKTPLIFNYLGVIYSGLGKLDSAYTYYKRSLELSSALKDSIQIAYAYENLADYYLKNAFYSSALESVLTSYDIFEKLGYKPGMAYALNDIGEVYFEQADLEKALSYFMRAATLRQELKDMRGYAKTLTNIAAVYEQQNKFKLAKENYEKALKFSREVNYRKGVSIVLSGLADISFKAGDYQEALSKTFASLENDQSIGNKQGELINLNRLGKIYIILKDHPNAHKYLDRSRAESDSTGHLNQLMVAYSLLTELELAEGDYKSAFEFYKQYSALKEKIFGKESSNKIADLQTAFITERKDKENDLLKKDIEFQKQTTNYIILISLLAFAGVFLLYLRFKSESKAKKLLEELNESKDRFLSVIGHDLKNPFYAVENLADILHDDFDELDDTEKRRLAGNIQRSAGQISHILSDLLTWAQTQKGGIRVNREELDVRAVVSRVNYSFETLAKAKGVSLLLEIPEGMKMPADRFIVDTILGNFVNNAIKFSHKNGKIISGAVQKEGRIELWVEDFGVGMSEAQCRKIFSGENVSSTLGTHEEKGTGLGLRIVQELAKIHSAEFRIESEQGKGSKFILSLPLR